MRGKRIAIAAAGIAVIIVVLLCAFIPSRKVRLNFNATYFYVCYSGLSDAHSASSVSSAVRSYGGAGYVIRRDNDYYVTVSCYYARGDADSVVKSLAGKGLNCVVVEANAGGHTIGNARDAEKFEGNLATLNSLSVMCYDLANAIDSYECDQQGAKSVLANVSTGLDSLLRHNADNCFSDELAALKAEYDDVSYGYVLSCEVRRLQIAITDAIVNVRVR